MAKKNSVGSLKAKRYTMDVIVHTFLIIIAIIWISPFAYLVAHSFRGGGNTTMYYSKFFPETFTFKHYQDLFTDKGLLDFPQMFMNTLKIACISCVISTFFVLSVSFAMSRLKWKLRRPYMNMAMVITLFPGFMSMTATYFLLKAFFGLDEHPERIHMALVICYCSGAGTGFYVMKGYMDTIPKALDEAAYLDGATKWQTFIKITLPLCKPMIVYQVITSFMGPWCDFIFCKLICRGSQDYYTVSVGLWSMLDMDKIDKWYTRFCAGSVMVAIPISILFIITQKFYQEAMSGSVKG
ncbi:MAG: ABC transporter permease subunit [Oscillospiraceae bacterium]|nr:ABC transporter permease subunit [Oscillospiraceae bacterium]